MFEFLDNRVSFDQHSLVLLDSLLEEHGRFFDLALGDPLDFKLVSLVDGGDLPLVFFCDDDDFLPEMLAVFALSCAFNNVLDFFSVPGYKGIPFLNHRLQVRDLLHQRLNLSFVPCFVMPVHLHDFLQVLDRLDQFLIVH